MEATVPYDRDAFTDYLGSTNPSSFVCESSARLLAGRAFTRALELKKVDDKVFGLSCTAALVSEKPKKGNHRAHIAVWSRVGVKTFTIILEKNTRTRQQEEDVVSRFIINTLATQSGIGEQVSLPLSDNEKASIITTESHFLPKAERLHSQEIKFFRINADGQVSSGNEATPTPGSLILSGSFNPFHYGHFELLMTAAAFVSHQSKNKPELPPVFFEISAFNADKPPIDVNTMLNRVNQFSGIGSVLMTNAPTFVQKARLFEGCDFVVGYDTAIRILNKKYYSDSEEGLLEALRELSQRKCRFIVGGRLVDGRFTSPSELQTLNGFKDLFISMDDFRADISSTEIRDGEKRRWRRTP